MKRIFYLITILAGIGTAAKAQEAMPLSLEDATNYALKHNAAVKNAQLDVKIQNENNKEITSVAYPQLNAKDEFTSYPNQVQSFVPAEFVGGPAGTYVAVPFTPKFGNTASASISQILFDGGVLIALKAKKTVMHLAELGAKSTEQDVRYNVQRAYYSIVVSQKQFQLIRQSIATVQETTNDMDKMYKAGFVEKIDVDRNNVQLNNLHSDSLRIANLLTLSEQMLKYSMGMDIKQPILLTDTSVKEDIAAAQTDLLEETDYNKRIEYDMVSTQIRLNEYDLKRYKYSKYPTLSAFGTGAYTYSSNQFKDVGTPSNYLFYSVVGATLNVPIFSGFKRNNQIKQAKYRLEKSQNSLENIKLSIDLQTEQARTTLKNAILTFHNEESNFQLANTVLDIANKKYKAGVGSSVEVNLAEVQMLQSQNNYFNALLDIINAKTDLQKATGGFAN